MLKKASISLALILSLQAESFNDFLKDDGQKFTTEKKSFDIEKKKVQKEFETYNNIVNEEFKAFKKELGKFWKEPKTSTAKTWVDYSSDLKSRKIVDFDNNTVTVDVHAKNKKEAQLLLAKSLINTITKDTKKAFESDILSQRIEKRLKKAVKQKIDSQAILAPLIFKKPPTTKEIINYAKKHVQPKQIQTRSAKIPNLKRYSVTLKLPKTSIMKKAQAYLPRVKAMSKEFGIPVSVILAIIQTESAFNPMARSHIPAFGLMQIVPRSAGLDVYNYLYKKRRLLSPSYLYNSKNNIKLGTAYLKLVYSKYLKDIKNPTSRLYCTIAAYNTGAGNVSRTFSGTNSPSKAAKKINTMTPNQVYKYLIKRLKYKETRNYLAKVTKRAAAFSKVKL
jgi:membrane-bound lytic murein transglycosylase C